MTRCYINLLLTLIYNSKTKQDKSIAILIWNTIGKLASLILLPHSDPLPGRYLVSNKNICKYQYSILFQLWRQTEQTVVSPPVLSTVVHEVRRSEAVIHNHGTCVDDAKVEKEAYTSFFSRCDILAVGVTWSLRLSFCRSVVLSFCE